MTRILPTANLKQLKEAKAKLKAKGWSYRRAAKYLGRHYSHIAHVLAGYRISQPILDLLDELPDLNAEKKKGGQAK